MKKLLLNTFGLLAVFFTLLAFSSTASAAEKSFTIKFKTGADNTGPKCTTSTEINSIVESGSEYVSSFSDLNNTYITCSYGLKIGTNSGAGAVKVTFASAVKATKIEVVTSVSKNPSYQKLEIAYNSVNQNITEFTFTDEINEKSKACTLNFDGTTEISSLFLNKTNSSKTSSQQGFIFIKSITVTYNEEVANPGNITPELTWSEKEVTAVLSDKSFNAPTLTVGPTENAEDIKALVEYKSSDTNVATIDEKGQITLVGRGKTTITAFVEAYENYNAQEASYELTVTYTPASLKWSAESVVVNMGDTFEAPTLTFDPEELAIAENLAYTSSDPTVAIIDAKGAVKIVGAGTTVITASIKGEPGYEDAEASYTLSVVDLAAVPDAYVLTFTDKTGESGTTTGYTNKWKKTLNDFTWEIANFNTNSHNNGWTYIKCGSQKAASVATITTASAMAYPVNQIDLTIDAITANSVNSIKLLTSTSATDFSNPVHSIDIEKTAATHAINIPNPQVNLYYCLEFNCKQSSNGVVTVSKVVYNLKKDNKESAELAYATTTVNKATTDQPFINPLTNEHGVEVVYSSDNEAVATVDAATGKVTIKGAGTTTISAIFDGDDTYSKQTVSYTLNVSLGVNSVEETKALEKNATAYINYPLTVAFVNGNNVFAVDKAGKFIQIYGSNSYAANDIIPAGWTGQYVLYNGNTPEIKPVGALPEAVAGGKFVPAAVDDPTTITANMVNSVVLLKNAVIDAATPTGSKENFKATIAGNTVTLRTNYMSTSASAGVYDITAVVNLNNNAVSLYAAGYKAVPAFRINGELVTTTTFDANGLKITLVAVLPEGHQMWYRFTPVAAASSQAVTDENGFTKYEGAFALEDPGQLEYYSVDPEGNKSEVYELRLDNVTGINDIVVDGDNSEAVYYNLQGVRVDNPNTGIYLVRRAGRVSKVFVK